MFLWDIAKDYNDFLMITPGENVVKFVYEPMSRLQTKKNEDLFHGPIYGKESFLERQHNNNNTGIPLSKDHKNYREQSLDWFEAKLEWVKIMLYDLKQSQMELLSTKNVDCNEAKTLVDLKYL